MDLDDVVSFVRVVEAGSFTRAAEQLGLPKSTVSRRVARLEAELGVRLLQRTTRTLHLTDAGIGYYDQVAPALAAVREAAHVVSELSARPQGRLRVTAPVDIGVSLLAGAVTEFHRRFPEVQVEVSLTGRTVDLVAEGFDLAIRAGTLRDSSLVIRKLADMAHWLFASPAYLEAHGCPTTLEQLIRHQCIVFRPREGRARWELMRARRSETVPVNSHVGGDDFLFVKAAMLAGGGIALLPCFLCRDELAAGTVQRVLPDWQQLRGALYVVMPTARYLPRKVTAFRDFMIEHLAKSEWFVAERAR